MAYRAFSHYTVRLSAGPMRDTVIITVEYYDDNDESIGGYNEQTIAFATTWKDVAVVIRRGLENLGYDYVVQNSISPMVDLS
jgi:hypothetical protein